MNKNLSPVTKVYFHHGFFYLVLPNEHDKSKKSFWFMTAWLINVNYSFTTPLSSNVNIVTVTRQTYFYIYELWLWAKSTVKVHTTYTQQIYLYIQQAFSGNSQTRPLHKIFMSVLDRVSNVWILFYIYNFDSWCRRCVQWMSPFCFDENKIKNSDYLCNNHIISTNFFATTSVKIVFCRRWWCIKTKNMLVTLSYDNSFFFFGILLLKYHWLFLLLVTCVTTFQPLSDFSFIITLLFIPRKKTTATTGQNIYVL